MRSKTLIVFVVDNGWTTGTSPIGGVKGKGTLHEAGYRTPIIFNWPGQIPAGEVKDDPVTILDLFPTLLDYAGVTDPSPRPGSNLRPVLEGEAELPERTLVSRMQRVRTKDPASIADGQPSRVPGGFFVRSRRWHYIVYDEREHELYDMSSDPHQEYNVADRHPDVTARLQREIDSWGRSLSTVSGLERRPPPENSR